MFPSTRCGASSCATSVGSLFESERHTQSPFPMPAAEATSTENVPRAASPVTVVRSESPELCLILIIMGDDHICSELFGRLGVSMTSVVLPRPAPLSTKLPPRMKISSLLLLPFESVYF